MVALTKCTDKELLQKLYSGDSYAFDALYANHWDKVYAQAYKRLQNSELAKDITQEVFVSLWARREINQIDNLPAYFFTAVRNNVFKVQRKQALFTPVNTLMEELYVSPNQADALLLENEFFKSLGSLIETLPPAQQQIFKMRYQMELSTQEIADQLQISIKTVQNQLGRALAQLRTIMKLLIVFYYIHKN